MTHRSNGIWLAVAASLAMILGTIVLPSEAVAADASYVRAGFVYDDDANSVHSSVVAGAPVEQLGLAPSASGEISATGSIEVSRRSNPKRFAPRTRAIVDAGKYDYLFGNVSSNPHNLSRSLQNQRQLNRIGVYDNAAGRDLLSSHFDEVLATDSNIVRTWTDAWGTYQIRESIFAGPNGVLKFESSWQVTSDGFRLETVIPFGGG